MGLGAHKFYGSGHHCDHYYLHYFVIITMITLFSSRSAPVRSGPLPSRGALRSRGSCCVNPVSSRSSSVRFESFTKSDGNLAGWLAACPCICICVWRIFVSASATSVSVSPVSERGSVRLCLYRYYCAGLLAYSQRRQVFSSFFL